MRDDYPLPPADPFHRASRKPPAALRDPSGFLPASTELAWLAGDVGGAGVQSVPQVEDGQVDEEPSQAKSTRNPNRRRSVGQVEPASRDHRG